MSPSGIKGPLGEFHGVKNWGERDGEVMSHAEDSQNACEG